MDLDAIRRDRDAVALKRIEKYNNTESSNPSLSAIYIKKIRYLSKRTLDTVSAGRK